MELKQRKWAHFAKLYDRHLPDKIDSLLEIGVERGGSLANWRRRYPNAMISGVDYQAVCRGLERYGFKIHIGDQGDKRLLRGVQPKALDVVIDDGGHRPYQVLASFKALWPRIRPGGWYVIEDLHMSEKLRWRAWQTVCGGQRSILSGLYGEANRMMTDFVTITREHPEVHLYPHIMFIHKTRSKLFMEETMVGIE